MFQKYPTKNDDSYVVDIVEGSVVEIGCSVSTYKVFFIPNLLLCQNIIILLKVIVVQNALP